MASKPLGRNQEFPIYNADGSSFHNLTIKKATVDSVEMSLTEKITGDVYYASNDLSVTMKEYVEYNGVKYLLVNPPTIVREGMVSNNSELKGMTKYSFEFYHPMYQLFNFPFSDVAVSNDEKQYLSEDKVFSWIGYPSDFVAKVDKNLQGTQWKCELSSNFPEGKASQLSSVLSFSNNTIADALKTFYDTWEVPYIVDQVKQGESGYSQGKRFKIILGLPINEIYEYDNGQITSNRFIFKMGKGLGLKNNSLTPRNNKIVTRIAGCGSENNVPYGYPQVRWYGESGRSFTYGDNVGVYTNVTIGGHTFAKIVSYPIYKGILGGQYVELIQHPFTRTHLMPSVYSSTLFNKISFLNSDGTVNTSYDPDITLVDYYDAIATPQYPYVNEINSLIPSYEFHEFEEIKPELGEETLAGVTPVNENLEPVADWDDTMNDEGEYVQSYFRVTLPQLSFDLYACAAITQEMQINMRSGACIGCTFTVQVNWESYKANFYDENGDFAPTGSQRDYTLFPDSSQGSINLILQKETATFGTLMPNIYQKPAIGDEFVILGISLPQSYITNAESRLDDEMKSYMLLNNVYYFDYPLKFDEHFLATNTHILEQIRLNTIVRFQFSNTILELYVKQLTVKFGQSPLPQYDITLTDKIEAVTNPIGKVNENVDKLSTLMAITLQSYKNSGTGGSGGGGGNYISRTQDDVAAGEITFLKGIRLGLLKLFGWDSKGNIKANDIKANNIDAGGRMHVGGTTIIDGLLTALRSRIDEIQSSNNRGSGVFESGWFITNNHNGHSYLEIDELLVRMKAIFVELEIRKETYSGGNVFYSPAGSVIYRVDCYDAQGNQLGISKETVIRPFTAGGRLLSLVSEATGLFSHVDTIVTRTPINHADVAYYRCYLIADDGTTKTRNWWQIGDQARCQTFNRASSKLATTTSDAPEVHLNEQNNYVPAVMDGNKFYWRHVIRVGTEMLADGKWYDYVDLSNVNPGNGYVLGSDIPESGDSIVCIGNRTNPSRMNMIMLEVIGDDAPAIKMYRGINSFSFDGRKFMMLSHKIQIRVGSIEYITDSGMELPPKVSMGVWKRYWRYHYYEEVINNGATWLCSITDGYRWETAAGVLVNNIPSGYGTAGEGLFVYGYDEDGNELKDRYYRIGTYEIDGIETTIYYVRNYTVQAPSDNSSDWEKAAGGSGVRGSFKSRVFCRTNVDIASAYYQPQRGDYDHPWPGGTNPCTYEYENGVTITWHDGVPNDSKEVLWSSVCTFYGGGGSSGWSIPSPETDTATLDIEFSPSLTKPLPPAVGANDTPPTTPTGTKINGDENHGSRANGSGSEADWYDTNKDANNTHADWANARWRAERQISNGVYDGEWVITKIKGEDGNGIPGDFQSTAFCRTNTDLSSAIVSGGTYTSPIPTTTTIDGQAVQISWDDGIPNGEAMLWATTRTFYGNGESSDWDTPRKMTDTQNYDVEFAFEQANNARPQDPDQYNRHGGSGTQIWYDPVLDNPLPEGTQGTWADMVWRAERETINGVEGTWVITRIKGEKGDPQPISPEVIAQIEEDVLSQVGDGISIMINPQAIIVKQETEGAISWGGEDTRIFNADIDVYRNGERIEFTIPSNTVIAYGKDNTGFLYTMDGCAETSVASTLTHTNRVSLIGITTVPNQESGVYEYAYDNGYIAFSIRVPSTDGTSYKTYHSKVAWYLNRLGNRIVKTMGDIETTYMTRREYSLNDSNTNLLRGTKNPTIGSSQPNNDVWSNSGSSSLTIVTLSDSDTPIQGYNKAFRVATTTYSFYQLGTFWSSIATYHFSAYVRAIGSNQTAKIYMSQPTSGGGGFTKTFSVGTDWELVTFDVNVSNYSSSIGTGIFYLGINSSGTIEYVAPTLVEIANAGVVKTDYEGKIETSANGLSTEFSERCDTIEGNVITNAYNISTLDQTAREIKAEVSRIEENTEIIMPASTWKSITITDYDIDEYWGVTTKDYVVIPGNLALAMTTTEDWVVKFLYYNSGKVEVGSSGYIESDQTTPYHDGQKYKPASVPSSAVYVKIIAFYPGWESDYGDTDVTHFINVSKPVLVDSKLASTGYVDVTADSVRIGITDDLSSTGIDITENTIHMSAQNTIIDSDVQVGSLSTLGEGCRVNIEGGVTEFFGMNGVCNIRLGLDDDGCAVLKFYNKDGVFMYDLGPNGIVHQLDSKDSTFVATAAIIHAVDLPKNEILLKYNQHANVTSLAQLTSGSTFYRFVEGYSSLTDNIRKYYISQNTVPSPYNDKTYNSQSHSPEQTTWHPTGTPIAAGYYVGNAINISGILYSRDVFEVYSSGDIPSYMGVLYYNYNVSEAKAYLCDASGDNFGESTKYKIIDYLNGNDPSIGPRPRI